MKDLASKAVEIVTKIVYVAMLIGFIRACLRNF